MLVSGNMVGTYNIFVLIRVHKQSTLLSMGNVKTNKRNLLIITEIPTQKWLIPHKTLFQHYMSICYHYFLGWIIQIENLDPNLILIQPRK